MCKMGAPAKYKKKYCEELIAHMSRGLSFETFAAVIDCVPRTLYNWEKKFPEFLQAKEKGFVKRAMMIEEHFARVTQGEGEGNPALMIFRAKNLLGWRDKQEIEHQGDMQVAMNYNIVEPKARDELPTE